MKTDFRDDQFQQAYPDGIEYNWWHLARNRIIAQALNSFARRGGTVLDVGCGRGITVKYLRCQGIECTGVELAKALPIDDVEQHVQDGTDFRDLPVMQREQTDTILLLDVIEHILEPVDFLQSIVAAFPNLSDVIVTVPARHELWSNYDDFYGHHRRYTLDMLTSIADQLSWKLAGQSYFFHLAYLPMWVVVKLMKKRNTHCHAPRTTTRWLHTLASHAMQFDYHLIPRFVPGTSIIVCFSVD